MRRVWLVLSVLALAHGEAARASGPLDGEGREPVSVGSSRLGDPSPALRLMPPSSPVTAATAPRVRFAAVFGEDDRVALPGRYSNLRHVIGLLYNVRARMVCSAFCVGDDLIATASHCLYKTRGETSPALDDFQFSRFADVDKKPVRLAGSDTKMSAQFVVAGSDKLSIRPPIDATRDWAVARLSRPICSQGYLTINPMAPDQVIDASRQGRLYQVAFHRDVPNWQLAYSTPCTAARDYPPNRWSAIAQDFSSAEDLLLHTCDTGGASSGSPLLIDGATGPEVVGINVGTYVVSQQAVKDGVVVRRYRPENVANTAVAARAIVAKLETLRAATILQPGEPMQAVQLQLRNLRLYGGPVDGRYGPDMKRAIESYEASVQLPVTGLPTRALMRRLSDENLATLESTSSITTSSLAERAPVVRRRVLGAGDSSQAGVQSTKRRLNSTTTP